MKLLERVSAALARRGIDHAVIGAAALAARGVARATIDLDLLGVDPACLDPATWQALGAAGVQVDVRRGDHIDPLAGVVRFTSAGERPVDLIVGRHTWQREVIARATPMPLGGRTYHVVTAADLILLKLYAGGPQDRWDIEQLLDVDAAPVPDVESRIAGLPGECGETWRRIRSARESVR